MGTTQWEDEEMALLRELWQTGTLPDGVAEILGKTVPDVLVKTYELQLPHGGADAGG